MHPAAVLHSLAETGELEYRFERIAASWSTPTAGA
jgi:hypothetical protein